MIQIALISFLTNSLNIRVLSSYLKSKKYQVTCFFCEDSFNESNMSELIGKLKKGNFSLVGISLVTDDYYKAVQVTKEIKNKLGIPVIWGGAHVNVKSDECLRHADMICLGEGEEALLEVAESISGKKRINTSIKNIWFKTDKGIIRNELRNLEENLDKYPVPDFDLDSQYVMNEKGFERLREKHLNNEYSIITSRGCPYCCDYCYNSYRKQQFKGKGRYLRFRSIENVIKELYQVKKLFKGIKRINFWDDSFVARKIDDFKKFKDLYLKKIDLSFFSLIEPMVFDYDKIKLLKESGLIGLQVGIQTGSERINKEVYNRNVSNKRILKMAHFIDKSGIEVIYDIIFNNPYETREDIFQTIKLFLKFPKSFNLQGYNLIFYPGTKITKRALNDGYISLKSEINDFTTIQGQKDTPITMKNLTEVSGRFYKINYNSYYKKYFNSVLALMAYNHVPRFIVMFFSQSETRVKKILLKLFVRFYKLLSGIKNLSIKKKNE